MKGLPFAIALLAAAAMVAASNAANATILCKDEKAKNQYVCWDEASRYTVQFPRKHPNGTVKTEAEVVEEGKSAVRRIMARTGKTDRVVLLDRNNKVIEEIPAWKVAFLRDDAGAAQAELERWKKQ